MQTDKIGRPTRLLRVRELTDPKDRRPELKPAPSAKSRFVAPHYFDAEHQKAVLNLLQRAGVGDPEGRRLFLTAAEYEIGAYTLTPKEEVSTKSLSRPRVKFKTQDEQGLATLQQAALHLAGLLVQTQACVRDALGKALTATDPFGRDHEGYYLAQLELELRRLGEACGQPLALTTTATPISTQARGFVLQIARIYRECLEVNLTAEALGPFPQILCLFRDTAELDIPCSPELLGPLLDLK